MNPINKLLIILITLSISCQNLSQENSEKNTVISIEKSFSEKNEQQFLELFPKNFNAFKNTFGWDDKNNVPKPLYYDSEKYIRYFFSLLEKPQNKKI
jgi:hypothetical protein